MTDSATAGTDTYAIAAQLPRAHSYHNDHLTGSVLTDPLLLLECFRQAGTVAAHRHLGVPGGTAFLIADLAVRFDADRLLADADEGRGPRELLILLTAEDQRRNGDRLLSTTLVAEFQVAGRHLGSGDISAAYMPGDGYRAFRARRRGSPAPMSDELPAGEPDAAVAGHLVGRRLRENVVLCDARHRPGHATARVDVPVTHPSLFDHPLDHVPAMVLLEAARQASLLAASDGESTADLLPVGLRARFHRFAELDAPIDLVVDVSPGVPDDHAHRRARQVATVEFRQMDAVVCDIDLTLASLH